MCNGNAWSLAAMQRIMTQAAAAEDNVRWARVLAELAHSATTLCPASCRHACEYIGDRLQVGCIVTLFNKTCSCNCSA